MFGRLLLLLLLLAAFATPAAAAPGCHAGTSVTTAATHHGMPEHPEPVKAPPAHACIGCAPVADWLGARIAARPAPDAPPVEVRVSRLARGIGIAPTPPPPRSA